MGVSGWEILIIVGMTVVPAVLLIILVLVVYRVARRNVIAGYRGARAAGPVPDQDGTVLTADDRADESSPGRTVAPTDRGTP